MIPSSPLHPDFPTAQPSGLLVALLAAGASRRLGRAKQRVTIDGEPLIRRQARVAVAAGVGRVVVVLGCGADACGAALAGLDTETVLNAEWEEGMAASVRVAATRAIAENAAALFILHVDQYALTAADLRVVAAAWRASPASAVVARAGAYVGPPVIIPASRFPALLALRGDTGAKPVLFGPDAPRRVEVDLPSAVFDLDTPEQLAALGAG